MDARELTGLAAPLQQQAADMSDPRQHFAWALQFFPSPNPQMGNVPIHPSARPGMSEMLCAFGFEHNPEKQTKWLIPGGHPEAGYLNVPKLVDRAEYEAYMAAHADPEAEVAKWQQIGKQLLGTLDPKLIESINHIETLGPEARAAAAESLRERAQQAAPAAFERLAELQKQADQQ